MSGQLGFTLFSKISSSVVVDSPSTSPGISVSLTPGVWICSYAVRIYATSGSPIVTAFSAFMTVSSTTNTGINGYNAFAGSVAMGGLGAQNLSLSSSSTIIQTTTQNLLLTASVTYTGGTVSYYGDPNPHTYIQATRIA